MRLTSTRASVGRFLALASLLLTSFFVQPQPQVFAQGPPLLSYADLVRLYENDPPPEELQARLTQLLNTPFVSNARGGRPGQPSAKASSQASSQSGANALRVATWNIERGLEFEAVKAAFTHDARFFRNLGRRGEAGAKINLANVLDQSFWPDLSTLTVPSPFNLP